MKRIYKVILRILLLFLFSRTRDSSPKLSYFKFFSLRRKKIYSGGEVKLLTLRTLFPESIVKTNLLYLVSSSLPPDSEFLVKKLKKRNIKIILNQNGVAYPAWTNEVELRAINDRNRFLIENSDFVIFQSNFCKIACETWVTKNIPRSTILYNPINTDQFKPSNHQNNVLTFLVSGSHHQPMRIRLALEFVHMLHSQKQDCHLNIAGRLMWPNAFQDTQEWIKQLNLSAYINFLGPYSQFEAPGIYQKSDVLLHFQDKDASPTVPLEAMASGMDVIAPKSGGIPELFPENYPYLIPVEQTWEKFSLPLASEVCETILKKPIVMNQIENRQKKHQYIVERFSKSYWIEQHKKILQEVLS